MRDSKPAISARLLARLLAPRPLFAAHVARRIRIVHGGFHLPVLQLLVRFAAVVFLVVDIERADLGEIVLALRRRRLLVGLALVVFRDLLLFRRSPLVDAFRSGRARLLGAFGLLLGDGALLLRSQRVADGGVRRIRILV